MPFPIKNLPKHILDKLEAVEGIRARKLENGDYEVYDEADPDTVIHTVTKDVLDEAAERLDLPSEPKKRTLW